jgi:polyisoprenoid-binding protein YceI
MHHGFTATATISRSAFGVSYGVPLVSDEVELRLDVQFIAPTAE